MPERALEGLRVVEFTDDVGPYCGKLLADLGAEVIKVEPPGGGVRRHMPPYLTLAPESPDTSVAFWVHNTSKRSVVLDLDEPEDRKQARALAQSADVILDDNPPGYLAARGLAPSELRESKPALVYTTITGFGTWGPHAGYAYSDIVGQAMGGVMTLAGSPDGPPFQICGEQGNISASIHAVQGTLLAVLHAEATGVGQDVEVSAQEALSMSQETAMQTWDFQKTNRARTGQRGALPIDLPGMGVLETTDGYVSGYVLAPAGEDFPALVDWMREEGMQGDLDDEPYATICNNLNMAFLTQLLTNPEVAAEKVPQLAHVTATVKAFFRTKTAAEAFEQGQGRRLLIGIVSTPKNIAESTQLRARDWFAQLEVDFLNTTVEWPGAPYRLSESPAQITRPPRLGEHTDEILGALA